MKHFHILTRRRFFDRTFKTAAGIALASLTDIPWVMKRALADGTIGLNGKKLLFIFLRGANDSLNSVIPVGDPAYYDMGTAQVPKPTRPQISISRDPNHLPLYGTASGSCADLTLQQDLFGTARSATDVTYGFASAIPLGNGFAALHPALKFLAPAYNAGELALVHRVGYPRQSRSHFDSQAYWENGNPNNNLSKDGIFYRTVLESGLAGRNALTGVSIQSSLPLLLRGSDAAMTNLSDPTRYSLLGMPDTGSNVYKTTNFVSAASSFPFADKRNREMLALQFSNMSETLAIFDSLDFSESGNVFVDNVNTDGDSAPYYLFPTTNAKNGGYALHASDAGKYVVDTGAYPFFKNLKSAAMILNKTGAIIAGTEMGGFDTHNNQGGAVGSHANLQKRIGWAIYALRKYFQNYGDQCTWNNLVVVTLSEFGRTTVQNSNGGTDHAEAGVMFVAGGSVKGGVVGCSPNDPVPWVVGPPNQGGSVDGSMFGVSDRYLKRCVDYRSVLGTLIRNHLGATQGQLNRIIPGYADPGEQLLAGGVSAKDSTRIMGEPNLV
jgi:uncharacterized protein (DUF1501 family)